MTDRIKNELDALFAKKGETETTRREQATQREQSKQDFARRFLQLSSNVLEPVFERFKTEVQARGLQGGDPVRHWVRL